MQRKRLHALVARRMLSLAGIVALSMTVATRVMTKEHSFPAL